MTERAAILAAEYINNNLDEFDLKCPLELWTTTSGSAEPVIAARNFLNQLDPEVSRVNESQAFIGPAFSSVASGIVLLGETFKRPLLSYSSTSSSLSDTAFFARTVSPQSLEALALAHAMQRFGWSEVATLNPALSTPRTFVGDLRRAVNEIGNVSIRIQSEFSSISVFSGDGGGLTPEEDAEFEAALKSAMDEIERANMRVVVLNAYIADVRRVLWAAVRRGWIGRRFPNSLSWSSPFVFVGTDFWIDDHIIPEDLETAEAGGCNSTCVAALREPDVIQGIVGVRMSIDTALSRTAVYNFFDKQWNPNVGPSHLSPIAKRRTGLDSWMFPNVSTYTPFAWDALAVWAHTFAHQCRVEYPSSEPSCSDCRSVWLRQNSGSKAFDSLLHEVCNDSSPVHQSINWNTTATGPVILNEKGDRTFGFTVLNLAPRDFKGIPAPGGGPTQCKPIPTLWTQITNDTQGCLAPVLSATGDLVGDEVCLNKIGAVNRGGIATGTNDCIYWPRGSHSIPSFVGPCQPGFRRLVADSGVRYCSPCDSGTFNDNLGEKCLSCPSGGLCPGGAILEARRGSWYSPFETPDSIVFHECRPNPNVCCPDATCAVNLIWSFSKVLEYEDNGFRTPVTKFGPDGMLVPPDIVKERKEQGKPLNSTFCTGHRAGLLCGGCEKGYSLWGQECLRCSEGRPAIVFGVIVMCAILLAFLMFRRNTPEAEARLVIDYLQTFSFLLTPVPGERSGMLAWLSNEIFALNIWSIFGVARQAGSGGDNKSVDLADFCPFSLSAFGSVLLPLSVPGIVILLWLVCALVFRRHKISEACTVLMKRASPNEEREEGTPYAPRHTSKTPTPKPPSLTTPRITVGESGEGGAGVGKGGGDGETVVNPLGRRSTVESKDDSAASAPFEFVETSSSEDESEGRKDRVSVMRGQTRSPLHRRSGGKRLPSTAARAAILDLRKSKAFHRQTTSTTHSRASREYRTLTTLPRSSIADDIESSRRHGDESGKKSHVVTGDVLMENEVVPWGGKNPGWDDDVGDNHGGNGREDESGSMSAALVGAAAVAAVPLVLVVPWFFFVRALWRLFFLAFNQVIITGFTVMSCRSVVVPVHVTNVSALYQDVTAEYQPQHRHIEVLEEAPAVRCWTRQHVTAVVFMSLLLLLFVVVLPASIITAYRGFLLRIQTWVLYRRRRRRFMKHTNLIEGALDTYESRKSKSTKHFRTRHVQVTPRRDSVGLAMGWTPMPRKAPRQNGGEWWCVRWIDQQIGARALPFSTERLNHAAPAVLANEDEIASKKGKRKELKKNHRIPLARTFGYASSTTEEDSAGSSDDDVIAQALGWEPVMPRRGGRGEESGHWSGKKLVEEGVSSEDSSDDSVDSDDADLLLLHFVGEEATPGGGVGMDVGDAERLRALGIDVDSGWNDGGTEAQCCGVQCGAVTRILTLITPSPIRACARMSAAACCPGRDTAATPPVAAELLARYLSTGRRFVSHAGLALDEVFIQYRPKVRGFYEVLMYMRRVLFALVLVFAAPDAETRQALLFAVILVLLAMQLIFRPFMRSKDDSFAIALLLLLTLVAGLETFQVAKFLEDARSIDETRDLYAKSSTAASITFVELLSAILPVLYVLRGFLVKARIQLGKLCDSASSSRRLADRKRFEDLRLKAAAVAKENSVAHKEAHSKMISHRTRTTSDLSALEMSSTAADVPRPSKQVMRARRSIVSRIAASPSSSSLLSPTSATNPLYTASASSPLSPPPMVRGNDDSGVGVGRGRGSIKSSPSSRSSSPSFRSSSNSRRSRYRRKSSRYSTYRRGVGAGKVSSIANLSEAVTPQAITALNEFDQQVSYFVRYLHTEVGSAVSEAARDLADAKDMEIVCAPCLAIVEYCKRYTRAISQCWADDDAANDLERADTGFRHRFFLGRSRKGTAFHQQLATPPLPPGVEEPPALIARKKHPVQCSSDEEDQATSTLYT